MQYKWKRWRQSPKGWTNSPFLNSSMQIEQSVWWEWWVVWKQRTGGKAFMARLIICAFGTKQGKFSSSLRFLNLAFKTWLSAGWDSMSSISELRNALITGYCELRIPENIYCHKSNPTKKATNTKTPIKLPYKKVRTTISINGGNHIANIASQLWRKRWLCIWVRNTENKLTLLLDYEFRSIYICFISDI